MRELDRGFAAVADIGVVVGELARLGGDGVGDLGAAVADIDAVEPGEGVEAFAPVAVGDEDAFATFDDAGGRFAARMRAHRRRGMEERTPVPVLQDIGIR